jgi:predicted sulfurtransferase
MYCTGGIRCDVYSAFLKQRGYNNLYTLEGGVQNYLAHAGGDHWKGSLFVFDGRMAINPAVEGSAEQGGEDLEQQQVQQVQQQMGQREPQGAVQAEEGCEGDGGQEPCCVQLLDERRGSTLAHTTPSVMSEGICFMEE